MPETHKLVGTLVGLAIGDAIGTTVEFSRRGTFPLITDMVGGGPFCLEAGQWTDDTSMALCLGASLKRGFDPEDQMIRYLSWWREGYMSSTGMCFDIGTTTVNALRSYESDRNPFSGSDDPCSSGNGALMRIAPVAIKYHDDENLNKYAEDCTKTTHGSKVCIDSSVYFCNAIKRAYNCNGNISNIYKDFIIKDDDVYCAELADIAQGTFLSKTYEELSNSGYVVDSLESALWCFYHTENFKDAILSAVNLGGDADTIGAICGQIAGAYYGMHGIPREWVDKLYQVDMIIDLAISLCKE